MKSTISALVAEAIAKGHEYMMLVVKERRPLGPRELPERVRIVPGLYGRPVNERCGPETKPGRVDLVVEVSVADAQAWLRRRP
jgi:hypothetical protein